MNKKKTKGRQKIEIKRVEKESSREVTFSKRKKGLFNKASELCELCGAEVAIFILSPHLKPFTFGHPDANGILQRCLTGKDCPGPASRDVVLGLNLVREQYRESCKRFEEEKKKSQEISSSGSCSVWDQGIEHINELDELEQYVDSMEKLKTMVQAKVDELAGNCEASSANEFNYQNLLDHSSFSLGPPSYGFHGI